MMTRHYAFLAAAFAVFFLAIGPANAGDKTIRIEEAWARATPGIVKTGAVYLSIVNSGTVPDALVAVSTPVAARAELHEMKMVNNVMEMRPVPSLPIAPGQKRVLAPGGYHIMLIGLKAPLKEGATIALTLSFAHAGAQHVIASVAKVGAMHAGERSGAPHGEPMPMNPAPSGVSNMPGMGH